MLFRDTVSFGFRNVPIIAAAVRKRRPLVAAAVQQRATSTFLSSSSSSKIDVFTTASSSQPRREFITKTEICTPPMKVYIEDTDAYGVIYNANYLRAYERALHMTHYNSNNPQQQEQQRPTDKGYVLQHDDSWSIVSVDDMKFKTSPPLGGTFVITGIMRASDVSGRADLWDMQMVSTAADNNNNNNNKEEIVVYNTATGIRVARPPPPTREESRDDTSPDPFPGPAWLPPPPLREKQTTSPKPSSTTSRTTTVETFQTFRDEFDPHLKSHMPLRNILNLFERVQSNYIGGPSQLRRLQTEDNIIYAVAGIRDLQLIQYNNDNIINNNAGERQQQQEQPQLQMFVAGDELTVETDFVMKKRGMMFECHHTVRWQSSSRGHENPIIATGTSLVMALDNTTRRPTSKLPAWLLEIFGISSTSSS